MENETESKGFIDVLVEWMQEEAIQSMRKKYKDFNALCAIDNMFLYIAQNRISPESVDGKHLKVELEKAIEGFNNSFKEKGIKPYFSLDWDVE